MPTEILTGNTPEKWEQIKTHPFYKEEIDCLVRMGEDYLKNPPPVALWSQYMRFTRDGNRSEYETPYFERRRRCAHLAVLTKLFGEKYLDALCDTLWLIMDESTWVLPAHMWEDFNSETVRKTFLDLFSTETGALLAETYHILGDTIPKAVSDRLKYMVRERVIEPYYKNSYWWMNGDNNWGAVCSSQVALCIMYLGTHLEFMRAEPQINKTMNLFLASYGKDGCCLEGLSYWAYGFGTFLNYADAVKNYTSDKKSVIPQEKRLPEEKREAAHNTESGVIDYFVRDDVKRASLFASNMRLHGECSVPFSDAGRDFSYPRSHFYIINKHYDNMLPYPPNDLSKNSKSVSSGSHNYIRYLLWSDPDADYGAKNEKGRVYYGDGQWFIFKNEKYSLAAKGGHNNEAHNHNDIGTFVVTTDSGMHFVDTGSGEYTRQYFTDSLRYDFLVTSSRGHSLPIINGKYQLFRAPLAKVIKCSENEFSLDYTSAYGDESLKKLERSFECLENKVIIKEKIEFSENPSSIVERFVSLTEPKAEKDGVKVGDTLMTFDENLLELKISSEDYKKSAIKTQTLYFVDFECKKSEKVNEFTFEILVK